MKFKSVKDAGVYFAKQKDHQQAAQYLVQALDRNPLDTEVLYYLAVGKAEGSDLEAAEQLCARALQLDKTEHRVYHLLGAIRSFAGDYAGAEAYMDRCLEIAPRMPHAMWNKAQCELMRGDYKSGFERYTYGRTAKINHTRAHGRMWDGERVRTLFLWAEQGMGDVIQMLRFVPEACQLADNVILEVYKPLVSLCDFQDWPVHVTGQPEDWSNPFEYDAHCSLMDLPRILGVGSPSDVDGKAYLKAPPILDAKKPEARVGVCWKGAHTHENDSQRSIPEDLLKPLSGQNMVALQQGEALFGWEATNFGDFAQTAAFLKSLDLVVTVDTSVAHLAGALGVPTWCVVPLNGEWRWGLEGEKSCWYDSLRLFRGDLETGFEPVVRRISKELNGTYEKAALVLSGQDHGVPDIPVKGLEQRHEATDVLAERGLQRDQSADPDDRVPQLDGGPARTLAT